MIVKVRVKLMSFVALLKKAAQRCGKNRGDQGACIMFDRGEKMIDHAAAAFPFRQSALPDIILPEADEVLGLQGLDKFNAAGDT